MASLPHTFEPQRPSGSDCVRFGVFEVHLSAQELRKQGVKVRLQGKPFQLLLALLEQPGSIVSREDLGKRLWEEETFVDYERGLNTAVNRLRIALGDSAETPRYVETVARTGYRFIAPVSFVTKTEAQPVPEEKGRQTPWMAIVAGIAAGAAVASAIFLALRTEPVEWRFRQATFSRGQVAGSRFTPDNGILYAAQWEDGKRRLYLTSPVSPESRPLGFENFILASVSATGELALIENGGTLNIAGADLYRVPLNGGSPRKVDSNIFTADWAPDGRLAVARAVSGVIRVEFPIGTVLYQTAGWISDLRVAPDGRLAFFDHPVRHDDAGDLKILKGKSVTTLAAGWASARGLAWSPNGKEVWFTAGRMGESRSLWKAAPGRAAESMTRLPGAFTLRDVSRDGRILLSRETRRLEMAGKLAGDGEEAVLSWLDWSRVQAISRNGNLLLFDEGGEAVGWKQVAFLHRHDSNSTVRLGEGVAMDLTPNERAVLMLDSADRGKLSLVPVEGGAATLLARSGLEYQWAKYFPDGKRLLALAGEKGKPLSLFVHDVEQPKPRRLTNPVMIRNAAIAPSGEKVAALLPDGQLAVLPVAGGERILVPGVRQCAPIRWSADERSVLVQDLSDPLRLPARLYLVRLADGRLTDARRIAPSERTGVNAVTGVVVSPKDEHYVYSYRRILSELFVADRYMGR